MSGKLSSIRRYQLPRALAEDCLAAIRHQGDRNAELFLALTAVPPKTGNDALEFQRAIAPSQICHRTAEGLLVTIDGEALFELNRACHRAGEIIAGQVHGHPTDAYHSGADDLLAMTRLPGALSIVVPDFGRGSPSTKRWSVHRLNGDGIWRPLRRPYRLELR